MSYVENMQNTLRLVRWQDYRGGNNAVVIHYESSKTSEWPVRDILDEAGKGSQIEPNLETMTYGYSHCIDPRTRNSFFKGRKGYLFFATNYQGPSESHRDKDYIVGYYRIRQVADVRKGHMRNMEDGICPELDFCHCLRAGEYKFVAIQDAFELSSAKLKEWGYKGKLSRQLRLSLTDEKTQEVLDFLKDKEDATPNYLATIEKLAASREDAVELEGEDGEEGNGQPASGSESMAMKNEEMAAPSPES